MGGAFRVPIDHRVDYGCGDRCWVTVALAGLDAWGFGMADSIFGHARGAEGPSRVSSVSTSIGSPRERPREEGPAKTGAVVSPRVAEGAEARQPA